MDLPGVNNHSLSKYVAEIVPAEARIDLLFCEDFNGDHQKELVIGYNIEGPYMYPPK